MPKIRGIIVYPPHIKDVIAATPSAVKEASQIFVHRDQGTLCTITVSVDCEAEHDGSHEDFTAVICRYEAKAQRVIVK